MSKITRSMKLVFFFVIVIDMTWAERASRKAIFVERKKLKERKMLIWALQMILRPDFERGGFDIRGKERKKKEFTAMLHEERRYHACLQVAFMICLC